MFWRENHEFQRVPLAFCFLVIAGSPNSFDEAVKLAFERANKTLRNITGMKIVDMTVMCEAGEIQEYRIRAEVIFVLE